MQAIAAEDYRLTFHIPSNCAPTQCAVFVGIGTNTGNSSYLDIYLEGQADGWLAVGFSKTSDMVSSSYITIITINNFWDLWVGVDGMHMISATSMLSPLEYYSAVSYVYLSSELSRCCGLQ